MQYPQRSRFGDSSLARATQEALNEIRLMHGRSPVISTNVQFRQDGLPYSNRRLPDDKGVAVYFMLKQKQMCFACDRWDRIEDNLWAIAKSINALRGIDRWGGGSMVEQAFAGFVALPAPKSPYEILGVRENATQDEISAAYRQKVKAAHPDAGGSDAAMQELAGAYQKLKGSAA